MARLILFDLDGTIYRGDAACPYAAETLSRLRLAGTHVAFLTNNSAATPEGTVAKLAKMGIACKPEEVYGSGPATARLLKERGVRTAYVVGQPAFVALVKSQGVEVVATEDWGSRPEVVVSGICLQFDYSMLRRAMREIRSGAPYLATNLDKTYPLEGGQFDPGSGSIAAAITAASGREPEVIGKPSPLLLQLAMADFGVTPTETLMVGDRADTDIAAGKAAGCATWLVLTGVESSLPDGQDGGTDLSALPV